MFYLHWQTIIVDLSMLTLATAAVNLIQIVFFIVLFWKKSYYSVYISKCNTRCFTLYVVPQKLISKEYFRFYSKYYSESLVSCSTYTFQCISIFWKWKIEFLEMFFFFCAQTNLITLAYHFITPLSEKHFFHDVYSK